MNSISKGKRGEQWKDVRGYEGLYLVSNLGRVESLPKYHYKESRILKQTKNPRDGRLSVMLCFNNTIRRRISVHQLVASAFIEKLDERLEVNHIDENPENNNVENLEWCTRKYNMNYGTTPSRLNVKNRKPIIGTSETKTVMYDAVRWGKQDGYDPAGINYSIKKNCKYKGLYWRYANAN